MHTCKQSAKSMVYNGRRDKFRSASCLETERRSLASSRSSTLWVSTARLAKWMWPWWIDHAQGWSRAEL